MSEQPLDAMRLEIQNSKALQHIIKMIEENEEMQQIRNKDYMQQLSVHETAIATFTQLHNTLEARVKTLERKVDKIHKKVTLLSKQIMR